MIRFTILGGAQSKANSRQIVTIDGRPQVIKSKPAREFERDALAQIPIAARVELDCAVRITLHLYYASQRSDLDESIVLDVLQTRTKKDKQTGLRYVVQRGVYLNDRQVKEKHVFRHIDKANPRCEILVEPLEAVQMQIVDAGIIPGPKIGSTVKTNQKIGRVRAPNIVPGPYVNRPEDGQPF